MKLLPHSNDLKLPTPYHRFIRFCASPENFSSYPGTDVWGTLERLEDCVVCALYKTVTLSIRGLDDYVTSVPRKHLMNLRML